MNTFDKIAKFIYTTRNAMYSINAMYGIKRNVRL